MDDKLLALFSRQMLIPSFGIKLQQKLLDSCVLIVGAGGLGCTLAQTLAGSGVGRLLIVDDDVVSLSNLPRQFLFTEADVGKAKATILSQRIQQRLPAINCQAYVERFDAQLMTTWGKTKMPQVIVDAGDNLELSWQLDQLASDYRLPLVHASVSRFEGHVYVRMPMPQYPTLATLFSQTSSVQSCSQTGVLTAAVAMVANYQATQVLRVLLSPCLGEIAPQLVLFDGLTMRYLPLTVGEKASH